MLKKERKCRITITESINEKLDSMESEKSIDAYEPKEDKGEMDFLNLVGEDIYFEKSEEEIEKEKRRKNMSKVSDEIINIFVVTSIVIGLIVFLVILLKINS